MQRVLDEASTPASPVLAERHGAGDQHKHLLQVAALGGVFDGGERFTDLSCRRMRHLECLFGVDAIRNR